MKKKILSQLFLAASLGVIYLTMSSDKDGKFNGGTNCSTCHGSKNTNTTVMLNGLPSNYIVGQTYPVSFTVINTGEVNAGFNIKCSGGTFVAGTGSKTNGAQTEITHTAPMALSGSQATFNFSWIAPASPSVTSGTFSAVGNAVNGNLSDDSGDQWNNISQTIPIGSPSGINEVNTTGFNCSPNPVQDKMTLQGLSTDASGVLIIGLNGQVMNAPMVILNGQCYVDCSQLTTGTCFVTARSNGKKVSATFNKL
ncbi:MAG TPA: hypothetical protein PLP34_06150 [Chitinophagaceae bacterium]|nr:hypothetical protein [Chitinophagaceae bacterium]